MIPNDIARLILCEPIVTDIKNKIWGPVETGTK